MTQLQAARFFGRFFSSLLPKKLKVHVESEEQPDGTIALTPVFLIGRHEVDPTLVGLASSQHILGYSIAADKKALSLLRQGPAKLTMREAAEYLGNLKRQGVSVRNKATGTPTCVQEVKPRVTLTLNPDDTLDVASELATDQGTVVAKPVDLERLRRDENWYLAEGNLLHVSTTNTDWDGILITDQEDSHLRDNAVPEFLKALGTCEDKLGRIEKNDTLRDLAVYGEEYENLAAVDGDHNSIHVSPKLVCLGKGRREHELTPEDLAALQRKGGYQRIPGGWIDIDPPHVEEYQRASRELRSRVGGLSPIEGFRIPDTLYMLLEQERFTSPWIVRLSEAVKNFHRIADAPADVEFRLQVIESGGRSILEIVPVYNYGRFELTHADHLEAAARREPWIRRQNTWIRVDQEAWKRIEAAVKRLGLQPGKDGFVFPANQREKVIEVFSPPGCVEQSPSYEDFLTQLVNFNQIEDVALPASLRPGITLRPYQKQGFNWLAFLHRFGVNGTRSTISGAS
jgi:hypothetical protein